MPAAIAARGPRRGCFNCELIVAAGRQRARKRERERQQERHEHRDRLADVEPRVDDAVDAEGQRKEQRALPETVAPALAHDEERDHAESNNDVQRIFH